MNEDDLKKLPPCNSERCFHYDETRENNCGKYVRDFQNNCHVFEKYQATEEAE